MLHNGTIVDKNKNIVIATSDICCHECAAKYAKENPEMTLPEAAKFLRGNLSGRKVKAFPALKDIYGEKVYLCESCAREIADSLKQ